MKKRKFRSAQEKQTYLSAMSTEFGIAKKRMVFTSSVNKIPSLKTPIGRETPRYPSNTSGGGNCNLKGSMVYTGSKMIGIGTLHKSNAVPVFSDEEAKDMATMRR